MAPTQIEDVFAGESERCNSVMVQRAFQVDNMV